MARRNLSRNRLRSALAALGIVIGVVAIASLGMFGTTLRVGATEQIGTIGNEVNISPNAEEGVRNITDRDVADIERAVATTGTDAVVVPVRQDAGRVSFGRESTVATIYGIERPDLLYTAADGRIPDRLRRGAVVGDAVADRLDLVAGNTVEVEGTTYRVRAVLEPSTGISLANPDNAVILPPETFAESTYDQVVVRADTAADANASAMAVDRGLNQRRERVTVFELSSITENIGQFFGILNAFLVGIGSVSLVVAGVSILNVMLMSTVERRGEIGVMRAVGVRRNDVVRMILAEAGLLGIVGGLVGLALSVAAGLALNAVVLGRPFVTFLPTNLLYLVVAFAFALGTSVLSGLYPAWQAATRPPVEAIQGR
jgi:putative ABC transport system permease protein